MSSHLAHQNSYEILADHGVTPSSTIKELRDLGFGLMEEGELIPSLRAAINELEDTRRRMLLDSVYLDPSGIPWGDSSGEKHDE